MRRSGARIAAAGSSSYVQRGTRSRYRAPRGCRGLGSRTSSPIAGPEEEEGESAGGARVLGYYLGDSGGGDGVAIEDRDREEGEDLEAERRGAPQVAPSAGEDQRATAIFGWEEGDDGSEEGVSKVADEIAGVHVAVATPRPLPRGSMGFLFVASGSRRRCLLLLHGRRLARRSVWVESAELESRSMVVLGLGFGVSQINGT